MILSGKILVTYCAAPGLAANRIPYVAVVSPTIRGLVSDAPDDTSLETVATPETFTCLANKVCPVTVVIPAKVETPAMFIEPFKSKSKIALFLKISDPAVAPVLEKNSIEPKSAVVDG